MELTLYFFFSHGSIKVDFKLEFVVEVDKPPDVTGEPGDTILDKEKKLAAKEIEDYFHKEINVNNDGKLGSFWDVDDVGLSLQPDNASATPVTTDKLPSPVTSNVTRQLAVLSTRSTMSTADTTVKVMETITTTTTRRTTTTPLTTVQASTAMKQRPTTTTTIGSTTTQRTTSATPRTTTTITGDAIASSEWEGADGLDEEEDRVPLPELPAGCMFEQLYPGCGTLTIKCEGDDNNIITFCPDKAYAISIPRVRMPLVESEYCIPINMSMDERYGEAAEDCVDERERQYLKYNCVGLLLRGQDDIPRFDYKPTCCLSGQYFNVAENKCAVILEDFTEDED